MAALLERGWHLELVVSDYGRRLLRDELGDAASIDKLADYLAGKYGDGVRKRHAPRSTATAISGAKIASGSQDCEAMVVVPCSMKTLAGIAHGLSRNLVERAADVMLKERRPLIIVPRETPMSLPQLKNMVLCAEAGAMIMPAMPAFYQMPQTLDDLADFMAGKILSALGFEPRAVSVVEGMRPATSAGQERDASCGTADRQTSVNQPPDKTPARIAGMFDAIAPRYDLLNHVLSAGLDRGWRDRAVDALALRDGARVLDLCTGTADLAIATVRRTSGASVVGVDFAAEMLRLGLGKIRGAGSIGASAWCAATRRASRWPIASCDAATIAFGIRNVAEPERALAEIARVLRPGGRLAILEFGQPRIPGIRTLYCVVFPLPAAARRTARLETPERVLVPARLGRHLSAASRVLPNHRCHRIFTRASRPSHLRHRLSVRC